MPRVCGLSEVHPATVAPLPLGDCVNFEFMGELIIDCGITGAPAKPEARLTDDSHRPTLQRSTRAAADGHRRALCESAIRDPRTRHGRKGNFYEYSALTRNGATATAVHRRGGCLSPASPTLRLSLPESASADRYRGRG